MKVRYSNGIVGQSKKDAPVSQKSSGTIKKRLSLSSMNKDDISGRAIKQFIDRSNKHRPNTSKKRSGFSSNNAQNNSANSSKLTKNEQLARIAALKKSLSERPKHRPENNLQKSAKSPLDSNKRQISNNTVNDENKKRPENKPPLARSSKSLDVKSAAPKTNKQAAHTKAQPSKTQSKKRKGCGPIANSRETILYSKHSKTAVTAALNEDIPSVARRKISSRRKNKSSRNQSRPDSPRVKLNIIIKNSISVQDLSRKTSASKSDILNMLNNLGEKLPSDGMISPDVAEVIASELGHNVQNRSNKHDIQHVDNPSESLKPRPPVVTIMGHVNHGKTTLLDALRGSDVAGGEIGGITQLIGAYQVNSSSTSKVITVLDTPGHEVFSQMRSRGASITDIVVLVVSSDDGIQEQTVEAINHAKAASVPIIVAVNKIDKPGADINAVITKLLQYEIVVESLGGDTISVNISAKNKTNLDQLEEAILLQAELSELTANPSRNATGIVLESRLDNKFGPVATLLVKDGSLKVGDVVLSDRSFGKVRFMLDHTGKKIKEAIPSTPVEIAGLNSVPNSGSLFHVVETEKKAKSIIANYDPIIQFTTNPAIASDDPFAIDNSKELILIVKCNVYGSLDAVMGCIEDLQRNEKEITIKILHQGLGPISDSDINMAESLGAAILSFGLINSAKSTNLAASKNITIYSHHIIYELLHELTEVMNRMLSPIIKQNVLGSAEVREIFNASVKNGTIVGCYVTNGYMRRGAKAKVIRNAEILSQSSEIKTLRRFKEDVKEVTSGHECGIVINSDCEIKPRDIIEVFENIEERRQIGQNIPKS